jgi:hypothetical protein
LDGPLPKLCPAVALSRQDGRYSAVALLLKAALIQVSDYRLNIIMCCLETNFLNLMSFSVTTNTVMVSMFASSAVDRGKFRKFVSKQHMIILGVNKCACCSD